MTTEQELRQWCVKAILNTEGISFWNIIKQADYMYNYIIYGLPQKQKELEDWYKVTINGSTFTLFHKELSYEYIVKLAELSGNPSMTISLPSGKHFTLSQGQVVRLEEGAVINIVHTNKA